MEVDRPRSRGGTGALPSTEPSRPGRGAAPQRPQDGSASSASPSPCRAWAPTTFDRPVQAAVRAFQTYARRAAVEATEPPAPPDGLGQEAQRRSGARAVPLSGPDSPTRSTTRPRVLIDHWIAEPNRWRCPVVVDVRTTTDVGSARGDRPTRLRLRQGQRMGAGRDSRPDPCFLFVTDFSALPPIVIPAPPPAVISRRLGCLHGRPGSAERTGPFTPAPGPHQRGTLTEGLWDTDAAKSTSRVDAVVRELPCKGFLDGIDAVTIARVVGLGCSRSRTDHVGSRPSARGPRRVPERGTARCRAGGVRPGVRARRHPVVATLGQRPGRRLRSQRREGRPDPQRRPPGGSSRGRLLDTPKDGVDRPFSERRPEWRGWHSVYRLASAARSAARAAPTTT